MSSKFDRRRKSVRDASAEQALSHHISILRRAAKSPEDQQIRLASIEELFGLTDDLGPDKTRDMLIPQLAEGADFCLSEFMAVAKLLHTLTSKVGGPAHMHVLLPYLEYLSSTLSTAEVLQRVTAALEEIVREIAANSLNQLVHIVVPLIERLSIHDSDTSRCCACALFSIAYPKLSTDRKIRFERRFAFLCTDDAVVVRLAAYKALPLFVEVMVQAADIKTALAVLLPQLFTLARDVQAEVRFFTLEAFDQIACLMTKNEAAEKLRLLSCLKDCASDADYRVRHGVVAKLCKWQKFFGVDFVTNVFLPAYQQSLCDENADVRIEGICKLKDFCSSLPLDGRQGNIQIYLIPCIKELVNDSDPKVKESLSTTIRDLSRLSVNQDSVEAEIVSLLKVGVSKLWLDFVFNDVTNNIVDDTVAERIFVNRTDRRRSICSSGVDPLSSHSELDGPKREAKVTNIFNLQFQHAVNPVLNLNVGKKVNVKDYGNRRKLNPCRNPVEDSLRRIYPDQEQRLRMSALGYSRKGFECITADKRKEVEDDLAKFLHEDLPSATFPTSTELTQLINNILADERRKP